MQNDKAKRKEECKRQLYQFTLKLVEFIDDLPRENISRRIGDQLLRSGTSIVANYIEAQSASSKKDYANFFSHALKSANESKLWVALLRDTKRAAPEKAAWFLKELDSISRILAASILTLKGRR